MSEGFHFRLFALFIKIEEEQKMKTVSSPSGVLFLLGFKNSFGFSNNNDAIVEWSERMEFGRDAVQDDTSDPKM